MLARFFNGILDLDDEIGDFLHTHPKIKTVARTLLATVVVAAAQEFGVLALVQEIFAGIEDVVD